MREIFPGLIFFMARKDEYGHPIEQFNESIGFRVPVMDIWTCRAVQVDPPTHDDPSGLPTNTYFVTGPGHLEGGKVKQMTREQIGNVIYLGVDFISIERNFAMPMSEAIKQVVVDAKEQIKKVLPEVSGYIVNDTVFGSGGSQDDDIP